MAYLYREEKCREGNPETCSKGKGSCPEGAYGGWVCGCGESIIRKILRENLQEELKKDATEEILFFEKLDKIFQNMEPSTKNEHK